MLPELDVALGSLKTGLTASHRASEVRGGGGQTTPERFIYRCGRPWQGQGLEEPGGLRIVVLCSLS